MDRIKKLVKWVVAGALILVAAKSTSSTVHEQADPLFCLPTLGGGTVCAEMDPQQGYELIGGFGG